MSTHVALMAGHRKRYAVPVVGRGDRRGPAANVLRCDRAIA